MKATEFLRRRGQTMLEFAVLMAAVGVALTLMTRYVMGGFNAHRKALEEELNGAMADNRP